MSEVQRWDGGDDPRAGPPDGLGSPDRLPTPIDDAPRLPVGSPRVPADPGRHRLPAVDRHRDRGLDLTPAERAARRSNRRWMLILTVTSVTILVLALIATAVYVNNEPSGPKIAVPAGYQAINDGYFSYAVPKEWKNNPANTDQAGDVDTSGSSGFAGEHISLQRNAPVLGARPPVQLQALGSPHPTPFDLTGGQPVAVPGTSAAFRYTATRPGGFRATLIDAYDYRAAVELWLMVDAPADVTQTVIASLRA